MTQHDHAVTFRGLHDGAGKTILVLPNAWDAMSARVIEQAGARAIATTSSGVSWALGRPDMHGLTRNEMIDAIRRIVGAVGIPVTADVESGYGEGSVRDIEETVRQVIGAGAVGVNIEDGWGEGDNVLRETTDQVERIAAARAAATAEGVSLFINARVDVFLMQVGAAEDRLSEVVRRAHAYIGAGADGVFVPGVADAATIGRLASAIDAPLNVMAGPGSPSVPELRDLGVARVSLGPGIARSAMGQIRRAAAEVLQQGTYESLRDGVPYAEADGLFSRAR